MSEKSLVTLSVLEIIALVAVLAVYLVLVGRRLRSIAGNLGRVAAGVAAIDGHTAVVGPGVAELNTTLEAIVGALPAIAKQAGRVAARVRGGGAVGDAQPTPNGWEERSPAYRRYV